MGVDEFGRWRQSARRQVRLFVKEHGALPPLVLWASRGANARRGDLFVVGNARTELEVRENIVAAVRQEGSSFAAIGRRVASGPDEPEGFGLVVVGGDRVEGWRAGWGLQGGGVLGLGPWRPSVLSAGEGGDWFFVQQAIRGAEKERGAGEAVRVWSCECGDCGRVFMVEAVESGPGRVKCVRCSGGNVGVRRVDA